ncbi:MAG: DUF1801 domain-containing protein [Candidatus Gracilibacteria bacterium]|nr:DUF1801 domain-containing protein [Candidatus Gracilibacteria bacterium]
MQDKKNTNIDEYISNYPKEIQEILQKIRKIINELSTNLSEDIKYGIPTFVYNKINLVHFAAYKNHIGFYPTPSAISHFQKELKEFKQSKGAIQFPLSKAINYDLIKHIVIYRLDEEKQKYL